MAKATKDEGDGGRQDALLVRSLEKGFRVLAAFDAGQPSMSLTQLAAATGLDKSAAQRFTHTLEQLGYLSKDPETRRYALTTRTLDLGYHYTRSNPLLQRALPYLQHLSQAADEAVSLSVLDGTEVVYVMRFMSRHMLSTNVIVGTRLPAYCSSPGRAILARLPAVEAAAILERSDRRPLTPTTIWQMPALRQALELTVRRGYAHAFEEIFPGDISLAAAVVNAKGAPIAAVSISVSKLRCPAEDAEQRYAPLVVSAAQAMSMSGI